MVRIRAFCITLAVLPALAAGTADARTGQAPIAALQVELMARQLYFGAVDGVKGPATSRALRVFQRRAGLRPDGSLGRQTRAAFGRWAVRELGARLLRYGSSGWDVAELQFVLAWHGFPSGHFDGVFGPRVLNAVLGYQRSLGVLADGTAGPETIAGLRSPPPTCPIQLAWPVTGPLSSPFGPRGLGFHAGVDLASPFGTPVKAAMSGRVTWASYQDGGWGNLVVVSGSSGVQSLYAHLSRIDAAVGQYVSPGSELGLVGATGDATGPHLHFEVRVDGAAVDPLPALR